jgi:hypothetical protein
MESGVIKISQQELHGYHVLKMVLDGRLSLKEPAKNQYNRKENGDD